VIETAALTGDDLRIADVWHVAVDGAHAALSDRAREKMRAALILARASGARCAGAEPSATAQTSSRRRSSPVSRIAVACATPRV